VSQDTHDSEEDPGHLETQYVLILGFCSSTHSSHILLRQFLAMTKATQQQAEKQSSNFMAEFQAIVGERKSELDQLIDGKSRDL